MVTLSAYELLRFVLIMLGIGLIGGIPIGAWITSLPIPDRRPTPPPADNTPSLTSQERHPR